MTKEKWEAIKGKILDANQVIDKGTEHYDEEGGVDIDFIEFTSPLGKTRLEFVEKPIVLDKKTTYSHRGGSDTGVEYIYSSTEKSARLKIYRWDDSAGEWEEVNAEKFSLPETLW
ncbi:MAG TPA: hypothetical protein VMC41_01350 [Candidatus Nanoarchaeia archaeon]|nr:hypothetical protein [Candidatus Nanoarchaeia archaeon]